MTEVGLKSGQLVFQLEAVHGEVASWGRVTQTGASAKGCVGPRLSPSHKIARVCEEQMLSCLVTSCAFAQGLV